METEKDSVEMNEDATVAAEVEQANGDGDTVDDEMSVDEAAENELIDSDIDEEDINPDKEELEQAVEEVDNQVDHYDENNDEPIQEADERETSDEQIKSDTSKTTPAKITGKDSTKTENKNKTTELPKKEIQKKIKSKNGVTAKDQTPEKKPYYKMLLVYPVTEEDLEGPVIKPVFRLVTSYRIRFRASREHSKQGALDMRYLVTNDNDKVLKQLSDVKLCGEIEPKVEDLTEYTNLSVLGAMERALDSLTEKKATEEQPVSVFVNNIPLDVRVDMLHFLYPSARSIQLPVNSQSAAQGYAIIEFNNLTEAKTVVKNNRTYPAQIGGKYLHMYVIGHEEDTGKPEQDKAEKRANERSTKSSEGSQKRSISESKSSSPKRSRRDDDERGSPSRRSSGSATRAQTDREDGGDMFNVFVGNLGFDASWQSVKDCLVEEMIRKGICSPGDNPIHRIKIFKKYAFAVFRSRRLARRAIKALDGIKFENRLLDIKEGQNNAPSEPRSQRRDRESSMTAPDGSMKTSTVYIGNAPKNTSANEFAKLFNTEFEDRGFCGRGENVVKEVRVKTGRTFQFLEFFSPADARTAVDALYGIEYKSHHLYIKLANEGPSHESNDDFMGDGGFPPMLQQSPMMNMNMSNFMSPSLTGLPVPAPGINSSMGFLSNPMSEQAVDDVNGYDVFVGNLPQAVSYDEIEIFFRRQFVLCGLCATTDNPIKTLRFRERRNFQFLVFHRLVDAMSCLRELNGVTFKGSTLKVKAGKNTSDAESSVPLISPPIQTFNQSFNQPFNQSFNQSFNQPMDQLVNPMMYDTPTFNPNPARQMQDYPDLTNYSMPGMGLPIEEAIEDRRGEYHVYFGDVPNCRSTEFLDFIKKEFRGRGLCGRDENPVKRLSFTQDRNFQFAVFSHSADAKAAIEELSGAIFKGSRVTTKAGQINEDERDRRRSYNKDSRRSYEDNNDDGFTVHIGNTNPNASLDDFQISFESALIQHGVCRPGQNPIKKYKFKLGKAFQYVVFHNADQGKAALQALNNTQLMGRLVRVERAKPQKY